MKLFQSALLLLVGAYVGQEYKSIPNIRNETIKTYIEFKQTEFYKNIFENKK